MFLEVAVRKAEKWVEGTESLASDQGTGGDAPPRSARKAPPRRRGSAPDDVGRALRSAYDETLRESVPDDFMDLLGKLS